MTLPPAIICFAAAIVVGLYSLSGQAAELATVLQLVALGLLMLACFLFMGARQAVRR